MSKTRIKVRNGPEDCVALIVENTHGQLKGHLIQPEQAVDLARDLMCAAAMCCVDPARPELGSESPIHSRR